LRTDFGHVAEKRSVCRRVGVAAKMVLICGSNPMSNILSASSNTITESFSSDNTPS